MNKLVFFIPVIGLSVFMFTAQVKTSSFLSDVFITFAYGFTVFFCVLGLIVWMEKTKYEVLDTQK